jgi:hypothetical protein
LRAQSVVALFGDDAGRLRPHHQALSEGHDVPMRNELAVSRRYSPPANASHDDILAVLAFCLIGAVASLYFAAHCAVLDQLPLLVIEYNLG